MIENLYNNSSYGDYLKQGAAISYEELQKRIVYVQVLQQQQNIAAGLEEQKNATAKAIQDANNAAIKRQRQATYAIDAYSIQKEQLNNVQNLANNIYHQTNNAYADSIVNMQNSLNTIVNNTNSTISANVGTVRAQFGSSDIIVDTGSAKDVATQVGIASLEQGRKEFASRVNDISNTINKVVSLEVENKYNNLNYDAQKYLSELNLNRSLNG